MKEAKLIPSAARKQTETEQRNALNNWADHVLKRSGMFDLLRAAMTLELLDAVKFDASDARWRQWLGRPARCSERQCQAWALHDREQACTLRNRRKSSRA